MTRILVLEHDASDPLLRLADWLTEAGAQLDVRRLHAGDPVPAGTADHDAIISLGGDMGANDDDIAPWLAATRALLAKALASSTPTLGICLGGQLLATAGGGIVEVGDKGPERGAYLTAKRDAAETDSLFAALPMTPDVMQYHNDIVSRLPTGSVLLLSGTGYPNQAWRQGAAAWGLQFHIEPTADDLRAWGDLDGVPPVGRFGAMLDDAAESMAEVWREFIHRFVAVAAGRVHPGMRLSLFSDTHPDGRAGD